MISLLTSLGIGGSVGVALGILEDPVANQVLKLAWRCLRSMSRGEHLSSEEKEWIRDYHAQKIVVDGYDYTEQLRIANLMRR